jgi:hypothetical protein
MVVSFMGEDLDLSSRRRMAQFPRVGEPKVMGFEPALRRGNAVFVSQLQKHYYPDQLSKNFENVNSDNRKNRVIFCYYQNEKISIIRGK